MLFFVKKRMKFLLLFAVACCYSSGFAQLNNKYRGWYSGKTANFYIFTANQSVSHTDSVEIKSVTICLNLKDNDHFEMVTSENSFEGSLSISEKQKNEKDIILSTSSYGKYEAILLEKKKLILFIGKGNQPTVILQKSKKGTSCRL